MIADQLLKTPANYVSPNIKTVRLNARAKYMQAGSPNFEGSYGTLGSAGGDGTYSGYNESNDL